MHLVNKNSDRLSRLPDCILIEILSLLKAKQMVQTCILSKRWVNLWASVPHLDFNFTEFLTEKVPEVWQGPAPESLQRDVERFENFVSRFLNLREDSIDVEKFHLECDVLRDEPDTRISHSARRWILYALNHKPKNLRIMLRVPYEYLHVPDCFFTCESPEEAYLGIRDKSFLQLRYYSIRPKRICLPNLRKLTFSKLTIKKNFMKKVLVGCPALESLSFDECAIVVSSILFENLVSLSIKDCCVYSKSNPPTCCISAPKLEYLEILGAVSLPLKLEDMSKVTKAIISIEEVLGIYNLELLSSVSHIQDLELVNRWYFEDMLISELQDCPTFHNLKILTLGESCMYCNFDVIPSFLTHCPNLEHLILLHEIWPCLENDLHDDIDEDQYLEKHEKFNCNHLKLVDVCYRTSEEDLTMEEQLMLDDAANMLERLLLHSTMEIKDVEIRLKKEIV